MDDREEGEVSDTEGNIEYVPVTRPNASQYRRVAQHMPSSDEDDNSDSDSDSPCMPKKKRTIIKRMDTDSQPMGAEAWPTEPGLPTNGHVPVRRNNVWANVLGEQCLTEEINTVGLKKLEGDRNVENYDFKAAQAIMRSNSNSDNEHQPDHEEEEEGEVHDDEEPEETRQMIEKRLSRKRPIHQRLGGKSRTMERNLVDIEVDPEWTDQELGNVIAEALFEQKPELIVRVVQVLGRETALKLYTDTKDLESDGGMMTVDGFRRRTSGGVYLQLLKKLPNIEPEQMQTLFPPMDKSAQQWRRRKRVPRKRVRHDSKPQGSKTEAESNNGIDDQLSDSAVGVKCPGSTPVTSPQQSDSDEQQQRTEASGETEKLEEAVVAAKIEAKIKDSREKEQSVYNDDLFEFSTNADEMELF